MSTNHNLFEEKGELKRNRAKSLLLTSLTDGPNGSRDDRTKIGSVQLSVGGDVSGRLTFLNRDVFLCFYSMIAPDSVVMLEGLAL